MEGSVVDCVSVGNTEDTKGKLELKIPSAEVNGVAVEFVKFRFDWRGRRWLFWFWWLRGLFEAGVFALECVNLGVEGVEGTSDVFGICRVEALRCCTRVRT